MQLMSLHAGGMVCAYAPATLTATSIGLQRRQSKCITCTWSGGVTLLQLFVALMVGMIHAQQQKRQLIPVLCACLAATVTTLVTPEEAQRLQAMAADLGIQLQEIAEPPPPVLSADSDAVDVDSARRGLDDLFNLYEAPRDD